MAARTPQLQRNNLIKTDIMIALRGLKFNKLDFYEKVTNMQDDFVSYTLAFGLSI